MDAPQQTKVISRTEHYVNISLGDSDEKIKPDYKQGVFRPTLVQMSWQWDGTQGWRLVSAIVTGPMVKKDGTDSQNRGNRRFSDYGNKLIDETPEWVRTLVDMHTPTVIGR